MDKSKLFSLAEKAIAKGQNDKALNALEQVLSVDTDDVKALNKAADLHIKQGNTEMALELLSRVGEIYNRDGFYSKAIAIYKRILKISDHLPKGDLIHIHENLATLYGQLGLVSDAMNHFRIVVDFYDQMNDRERLLVVLGKVSDLDPSNVESQLRLAELYVSENKEEEAHFTLTRLVDLLREQRKMPEVIEVYEKWTALCPASVDLLQDLIRTYINSGEPKKALSRLQKAFRSDPYNSGILELLSTTFREMKQPEKSRAVDLELIKIYRKNGEEEKLEVVEARVANRPPEGPGSLADVTRQKEAAKKSDALDPAEELIRVAEMDPDEKKVLSECEVYLKYGLAEKAREVLSAQLSKFPKSLALRWKLRVVLGELQEVSDIPHVLGEMILLAKEANASEWLQLSADELREMDAKHPALESLESGAQVLEPVELDEDLEGGEEAEAPVQTDTAAFEGGVIGEDTFGDSFDESDISIVIEDEEGVHVQSAAPKKTPEQTADTTKQPVPSGIEDEGSIQLEELEEETLQEPDAGAEMLLSDADFSDEELQQLGHSLTPVEAARSEELRSDFDQDDSVDVIELATEEAPPAEEPDSVELAQDEDFEVQQALEEVAFFKSQGLVSEAEQVLEALKRKYPNRQNWDLASLDSLSSTSDPEETSLRKAERELEALGTKMKLTVQEDDRGDEEDYVDLAAELEMEDLEEEEPASSVPSEVKDVFAAFKKGVSESVSEDDYQTHFDLGIAYREMGLIDDAIQSFQVCAKITGKKASSLYQVGLCEAQRENYSAAKKAFDEALDDPSLVNQEKISISYELAESLLKLNDRDKAKELFEEVKSVDPDFREVSERIEELSS